MLPAVAAWIVERRRDALPRFEGAAVNALAVAAAFFAAAAIPVQLDGVWISVGWSLEAMVLAAISFPLRLPQVRWFGYLVLAAASIRLLAFDTPGAGRRRLHTLPQLHHAGHRRGDALGRRDGRHPAAPAGRAAVRIPARAAGLSHPGPHSSP